MAGVDLSRINTNVGAINMMSSLRQVNKELSLHQTRIATGKRINEASDDPGGFTLGLKMERHSNHLQQAMDNIGDGKNLLSVAEGGLKKVNDILGKMRIKAEQAANDTMGTDERTAIKKDLDQYAGEIDDIVKSTTWNGKKLLDGLSNTTDWAGGQITLQTGVSTSEITTMTNTELASVAVTSILSTYSVAKNAAISGQTMTMTTASIATGTFTMTASTANINNTLSSLGELGTGSYTLLVSVSSAGGAAGGTLQVLDGSGNAISLATGSGSTSSTSLSLNVAGAVSLDTGRGFNIAFNGAALTGVGAYAMKFTYTKASAGYDFAVNDSTKARTMMADLDSQITKVSERLQNLGALQSRLDFKTENLATAKVNTQAAYSRLMDADMAEEQLGATRSSILQQTATSMLAQANQSGQSVMQLFR